MATTLSYLDTKNHRLYDRTKANINQGLVTITNEFGKFDNSCIDFTNPDHTGILFPDGVDYSNEAFTISAWIRLTDTIDNFVFIGNADDVTDIDAWESGNDTALSAETLDHTTPTEFVVSTDTQHLVNASIIALEDYTWHHFVLTRIKGSPNDSLIQFVDGVKISETTLETAKNIDFSKLVIGCSGGENPLIGYMDDFCLIKGANIWTAAFTPPAVPIREATGLTAQSDIAAQTARTWNGSTDIIDCSTNPNIATWELLELNKSFALKL